MTELDRYLDRLGDELERARPRRSRRPLIALPVLAALAAAIVAATFVFGPGGQSRPVDAVAAARAALETDGRILYMKVRIELDPKVQVAQGALISRSTEQWSQSEPKRWRFHETRTNGSWSESSYADGTTSTYDSLTNRGRTISGYADTDPQARPLGLLGVRGGNDPNADLKTMLAQGKLKDAGLVEAHGRTVRRLQDTDRYRNWVYDVDPDTFAPVAGAVTLRLPDGTRDTTRFIVEAYERLPLGTDVFTIETKPHAKVETLTKAEFMEPFMKQRRKIKAWGRCVKRNRGIHKGCGPSPYTTWP